MERRVCWAMGDNNPLVSVHDVGAGGLSNAMHELVHEWDLGLLNPTRELIQASHSTSHPHPHHVQRLKDVVTHCPTHITRQRRSISGLSRCTVQRDNPEMERRVVLGNGDNIL